MTIEAPYVEWSGGNVSSRDLTPEELALADQAVELFESTLFEIFHVDMLEIDRQ